VGQFANRGFPALLPGLATYHHRSVPDRAAMAQPRLAREALCDYPGGPIEPDRVVSASDQEAGDDDGNSENNGL
jgi:hypothetical protein